MSSSFDSMQYALQSLTGDESVKVALRHAIDALHDWDHKHEGTLNRLPPFAREAREADRLAALAAEEET